jgi:hypothetical protein
MPGRLNRQRRRPRDDLHGRTRLAEIPVTGAPSTAVLAVAEGASEFANECASDFAKKHAKQATSQASDAQRRASILCLRALASQRPGLPGIGQLVRIMELASPGEDAPT